MNKLFTIENLGLNNRNISFFNTDMFQECEYKLEDRFIAENLEVLHTFLCASLDSQGKNNGMAIAFMNDDTAYIALQSIRKIGKMNIADLIPALNVMIQKFKITYMTILQQDNYDDTEYHFIADNKINLN